MKSEMIPNIRGPAPSVFMTIMSDIAKLHRSTTQLLGAPPMALLTTEFTAMRAIDE